LGREVSYWREWLHHPRPDDYWKSVSTLAEDLQVAAPVFQQGGWYDPYVDSIFHNFNAIAHSGQTEEARTGQRVMIGPWSHDEPDDTRMGDLDLGPDAYVDLREEELRWYDTWLKGIDSGITEEPPIRIFVMGPATGGTNTSGPWHARSTRPTTSRAAATQTHCTATAPSPPSRATRRRLTGSSTTRSVPSRPWVASTPSR
jgi:putative CocE/NonD family hydrolase